MPIPLIVKAGILAVTVAVTAAVILYENPEVRRHVDRMRRRFAAAMSGRHFTEEDYDEYREPMYNRPEDADGFMMSSQHRAHDKEDSDEEYDEDDVTEETRIRQREELNFWKAIQESQEFEEARKISEKANAVEMTRRGSATRFDDFLKPDASAETGTFVYNSGTDARTFENSGLRRRGENQSRAMDASLYSAISSAAISDSTPAPVVPAVTSPEDPSAPFRVEGNIYTVTPQPTGEQFPPASSETQTLIDVRSDSSDTSSVTADLVHTPTSVSAPSDPFSDAHANSQNSQSTATMAFASIQAWAEGNDESLYASMPSVPTIQPAASAVDPSVVSYDDSEEMMTPVDSMSQAGSGVVLGNGTDTASNAGSRFDVISQTDGMRTPASWSEIGSVVSDDDMHVPA